MSVTSSPEEMNGRTAEEQRGPRRGVRRFSVVGLVGTLSLNLKSQVHQGVRQVQSY